jgi:uncharacterized membrane protein YesL
LPVVTIGASTTALFYVTTRRISDREGYITRDFWTAFKSNFKKATGIWLLQMLVLLVLYLNITKMGDTGLSGNLQSVLLPFQFVFLLEVAFTSVYLYALTARFEMSWKQLIKSAFFMANRHFLTSFTCVLLGAAIVAGIIMYEVLIFAAMGLYAWLSSYLIMRVFKKYRPEMDKDPRLELQEIEAERAARKDGGGQGEDGTEDSVKIEEAARETEQ